MVTYDESVCFYPRVEIWKISFEARWQHSSPFGHARASARRDRVWDLVSLQGLPEPLLGTYELTPFL